MSEPVDVYLVRHGQTDLNRDKRFRGLTDVPLNDQGRREASGAAALLADSGVSVIHSSPVPRALETSSIIAGSIGARVEEDDGFTDVDYGRWQGLTVPEVTGKFGQDMVESWQRDPGGFVFPDGDAMSSVGERLAPALERIATGGHKGVAVVSHLAIIKICLVAALGLGFETFWRVSLDNGSVSRFSYTPAGGFVLEWWNRVPGPQRP